MKQPSKDYLDFRFRLRHDRLLRLRLRHARYHAELELARELGYAITMDDLRGPKAAKHATDEIC
jgi:hypothetical protein